MVGQIEATGTPRYHRLGGWWRFLLKKLLMMINSPSKIMVVRVHTNLNIMARDFRGNSVDLKGCTGGGLFSHERKRKGGGGGGLNKSREGS